MSKKKKSVWLVSNHSRWLEDVGFFSSRKDARRVVEMIETAGGRGEMDRRRLLTPDDIVVLKADPQAGRWGVTVEVLDE